LKRERMDHFVGAAICLFLTAAAVLASIITALPAILRALSRG
jgi:hypothetical protein